MRHIREVLRLSAAGLSRRRISESTGTPPTTIHEYLQRAAAAGLSWPLPDDLDDEELEARLFKRSEEECRPGRPEPDWAEVQREMKRKKGVTLQLLWLEYRKRFPEGWGYTQFCVHFREWEKRQDSFMHLRYPAGERTFVDFSGVTMPVWDETTGEKREAQVFVGVLACSGYFYVEAVEGQDLANWLTLHARMFAAFGGVSEIVVPDNLKSGVTDPCWYEPEVNRGYEDLTCQFGTVILPARPRHPRDKAAVEACVQFVQRWVLAPLRNHRHFSLAELNADIFERTQEALGRPFRNNPASRRNLFEDLERAALKPLPDIRYEFAEFKTAKAGIDYHVRFDDSFYSVPYRLAGEVCEVRATQRTIEIFHSHRRVASHLRSRHRGEYVTDPEHMPASHRAHTEWSPQRLMNWGAQISPEVEQMVTTIMERKPHPEQGYRACLGLLKLAKRYGPERLSAACERALALSAYSYRSVHSILKNGLDQQPLTASAGAAPIEHENVRGPQYYREVH
jgi:transposase